MSNLKSKERRKKEKKKKKKKERANWKRKFEKHG
jgi:hypothetical protein